MAKMNPVAINVQDPTQVALIKAPIRLHLEAKLADIAKVATHKMLLPGRQSSQQFWTAFFLGGLDYIGVIDDRDAIPSKWTILRLELDLTVESPEEDESAEENTQTFVEESTLWELTAARQSVAILLDEPGPEGSWLLLPTEKVPPLANGRRLAYMVMPANEDDKENPQIPKNVDWDTLLREVELVTA